MLKITGALGLDPKLVENAMRGGDVELPPASPLRPPEDILSELQESLRREPKVLHLTVTRQPGSAGYGDTPVAEVIDYVPHQGAEEHTFLPVPVSGDCMEPDLPAGTVAVVDFTLAPQAQDGDLVLASHEGEHLFKWLEMREAEHWLVANQGRPPIKANGETVILGVVVSAVKPIRRRRRA